MTSNVAAQKLIEQGFIREGVHPADLAAAIEAAYVPKHHRWNIEQIDGGIRICEGNHERSQGCQWTEYVPKEG